MKLFCSLLFLTCLTHAQAPVPSHKEASTPSVDAYSIVWENNIFDPSRTEASSPEAAPETTAPPPAEQIFTLLGTLVSPSEAVAFFSGPGEVHPSYTEGMQIAGATIMNIDIHGVQLERETTKLFIPVSKGVSLSEDGAIAMKDAAPVATDVPDPAAKPAPERDGADSGILEALRQRRQKELGK